MLVLGVGVVEPDAESEPARLLESPPRADCVQTLRKLYFRALSSR